MRTPSASLGRCRVLTPGPGQPRWDASEVADWVAAGRPAADAWKRLRPRRR